MFKACISKLKFQYWPDDFKNPAIEKLWSEIETIALDRGEPEVLYDLTIPNNERIDKRAGNFLSQFAHAFGLDIELKTNKRNVILKNKYLNVKFVIDIFKKAKENNNQALKKLK